MSAQELPSLGGSGAAPASPAGAQENCGLIADTAGERFADRASPMRLIEALAMPRPMYRSS